MYRIDKLLKSPEKLFHTQDLALLWGVGNKNTLYTSIKRYVNKGILIPIHKGFYATVPLETISPIRLGIGYLHTYAYVSCENVLIDYGVIFQHSDYITLISSYSKKFTLAGKKYFVRKLHEQYLNNPFGVKNENNIFIASLERAIADILYFNPRFFFDAKKQVDWSKVKKIQKEVYHL